MKIKELELFMDLEDNINNLEENNNNKSNYKLNFVKANIFKKIELLKSEESKYLERIEILNDFYYNYYINENEIYESLRDSKITNLFFERLESLNKIFELKNKILEIEKNIIWNLNLNESSKYNILRNSIKDNYSKIKSSFLMKLYEYSYYNFNHLIEKRKFNKIKKICKYLSEDEDKSKEIIYIYFKLISKDFLDKIKQNLISNINLDLLFYLFNYYFLFILKTINNLLKDMKFKIDFLNTNLFNLWIQSLELIKNKLNIELYNPVDIKTLFEYLFFIFNCYYTQKNIYKKYFSKMFKNNKILYFKEINNFYKNYFNFLFNKIKEYENEFNYFSKKNNQYIFIKEYTYCIKNYFLSKYYLFFDEEIKDDLIILLNFYVNLINYYDTDDYILLLNIEEILKEIQSIFNNINYNDNKINFIINKNKKFLIELINKDIGNEYDNIENKRKIFELKLKENNIPQQIIDFYINQVIL